MHTAYLIITKTFYNIWTITSYTRHYYKIEAIQDIYWRIFCFSNWSKRYPINNLTARCHLTDDAPQDGEQSRCENSMLTMPRWWWEINPQLHLSRPTEPPAAPPREAPSCSDSDSSVSSFTILVYSRQAFDRDPKECIPNVLHE